MAETILGTVVVFVYVATVGIAPVAAIGVVLLSRRRSTTAALGTVVGALAAIVTLGATAGAALLSFRAGVVLFVAGQGALVGAGVVPLLIGRAIIRQTTGVDRERALRVAVAAWPLTLVGSFTLFLAPGGFTRYNLTFLSGPAAVLAWLGWGGIVLLGPGILGASGIGLRRRL